MASRIQLSDYEESEWSDDEMDAQGRDFPRTSADDKIDEVISFFVALSPCMGIAAILTLFFLVLFVR